MIVSGRINKAPIAISKIVAVTANKHSAKTYEGKIRAVVGTVTDDNRLYEVPKMTICALRFTATARARIEKAGGECLTFDQLAMRAPTGSNVILLRGPKSHREAVKHFGFGPHSNKVRLFCLRNVCIIWTSSNNPHRSRTWRARAGSSSVLVVADGRVVSRSKAEVSGWTEGPGPTTCAGARARYFEISLKLLSQACIEPSRRPEEKFACSLLFYEVKQDELKQAFRCNLLCLSSFLSVTCLLTRSNVTSMVKYMSNARRQVKVVK